MFSDSNCERVRVDKVIEPVTDEKSLDPVVIVIAPPVAREAPSVKLMADPSLLPLDHTVTLILPACPLAAFPVSISIDPDLK